MTHDAAYHLSRAGQWDLALAALDAMGDNDPDRRAEIVVERWGWTLGEIDMAVVEAASPEKATDLTARISYFHKLFKLDGGPDVDEAEAFCSLPGPWPAFWHGVVQDNLHENHELAQREYARAHELAPDDLFLESFVVRHQAVPLLETDRPRALTMLRRSMNLRATVGARPQLAAAQATLADMLGPDHPEGVELRALARTTAHELNLTWLKSDLP